MSEVDELQNNLIAKVIIEMMTTSEVSEVWFKISFLASHTYKLIPFS